ncbi:MAG: alpha/beta fold hydrolase [Aeromicrobium sp.]
MADVEFAETPGGRLAYERRGSGEPLLLIMGVAGHHGMWGEPFLEALAKSFDVVAFDHRGIGESARADREFTITELADDAAAVMGSVGWESAHVMGISMGGTVAQELALRHPERVRRLVLGCTWPGTDGANPVWGASVGKLAEAGMSGDAEQSARLMFAANVSQTFAVEAGRFEEFASIAESVRVPGPVVLMQMQAAAVFDSVDRLATLGIPTLVIHGSADEVILPAAGERLAGLIPGSRFEEFDGVGHLFFWEQPDRSADLVTSHLLAG